jgi:nitrous oxide reductase accessory protein NosL
MTDLPGFATRPLTVDDATAVYQLMAAEQQQTIGRVDLEDAHNVADWARPSNDVAAHYVGVLERPRRVG